MLVRIGTSPDGSVRAGEDDDESHAEQRADVAGSRVETYRTPQDGKMILTLTANLNGDLQIVAARRSGRAIAVESPAGTSSARNINQATRIAASILGPTLEQADRTGAKWGLFVSVEGAGSALFGEFPPGPASPTLTGPPAKPSAPIAQVFRQWQRDGSALGALDAALKIIEIYAERRPQRAVA